MSLESSQSAANKIDEGNPTAVANIPQCSALDVPGLLVEVAEL